MRKLCPICKGKLWSEPVKIQSEDGSYYSNNFKRDGIDVCCDKGHRFQLTAKHYQEYLKHKKVL